MKGADIDYILIVTVFLPVLAGIGIKFIRPISDNMRALNVYVISALALTCALAIYVISMPSATLRFFQIAPGIEVFFSVDGVSKLFSGLVVFVWLLVGIYATKYMTHEGNMPRFFTYYLIVLGIILGMDYAGNIVTLYAFFELLTFCTIPLIIHSMKKDAIRATYKYLFYSVGGAFLGLIFIFFITNFTTTGDFAWGGTLDPTKSGGNEPFLLVVIFVALIGFGTKAGMFPMHAWLPSAHPVAPSPASAVLSGIITKAGILALIRVVFYTVGIEFIAGTWVQYTWIILALITVLMGSMMAFKEKNLKKRLAYSSVSQLSYIILGLAFLTGDAFTGGLLHVVFHSIVKNTLFLVAGAVIFMTHKTNVDELAGIGRQMPVTMTCFTIVSVTLVGIPPTAGFISKWEISTGALSSGVEPLSWIAPVVLLISALLTAGYLFPIAIKGFLGNKELTTNRNEAGGAMLVPMIILSTACVCFGLFPDAITSFISGIPGM